MGRRDEKGERSQLGEGRNAGEDLGGLSSKLPENRGAGGLRAGWARQGRGKESPKAGFESRLQESLIVGREGSRSSDRHEQEDWGVIFSTFMKELGP